MPSILVVDDDEDVCTLMRMALAVGDREVEVVTSAAAAIAMLGTRHFDVIVTDLNLEIGMSGEDLLEHLQALSASSRVILISGFADAAETHRFRERGAFDFLTKPFELRALAEVVDRALASA